MTRGLDAAQDSLSTGYHRLVVPLVDMYFTSGTLYLTSAPWNIGVGGITYLATGPLMTIKQRTESAGSFEGVEFTMNGLDPAIITLATQEPYKGRLVKLLKAYLDPTTHNVVGAPVVQFVGRIRAIPISENNSQATVTVQAEHYEAELQRPNPLRLNNSDQQRFFPGDLGAEHVEAMVERVLIWPNREALKR